MIPLTARQHRFLIVLLCLMSALAVSLALSSARDLGMSAAHAQGVGSGAAAAPAAPVSPTVDPVGFVDQVIAFAHTNWILAAGLGLFGLLELLCALGKDVPALAALGKGRVTLALAGAATVLGAALNSALNGGSTQTAILAAVAAIAAFWHPAAPEVAAARAAKAKQAGFVALWLMSFVAAIVIVGCAWWSSSGKQDVKTGGVAIAACAIGDLTKYAKTLEADLAKDDYATALAQFKADNKVTDDALTCLLDGILAVLTAQQPALVAGQESPIVVHAKEWLAAHGAK